MAQILNFRKMEVVGASKEEAFANAPFSIMGDATQAYNLWKKKQVNGVTEAAKKQFYMEYLEKKSKNVPGVGFAITLESAVKDTRERPWAFKEHKTDGSRKYKTIFQIYENLGTDEKPVKGKLLAEADCTKAKSKNLGKELIEKGYHGKFVCYYTKQVIEGSAIAWTGGYSPSANAKPGSWVVFGIAAE